MIARKKYNGIVSRIKKEDMPAYFGHWIGATNRDDFKKEIKDIKSIGKEFKDTLLWRMCEAIARKENLDKGFYDPKEIDIICIACRKRIILIE